MFAKRYMGSLALAIALHFLLVTCVQSEGIGKGKGKDQCDYEEDSPSLKRIFYGAYKGGHGPPATRDNVVESLGECKEYEDYMDGLFSFFAGYGVNIEAIRNNPETVINETNFIFQGSVNAPYGNYRVVSSVFNGYAKVMNSRIFYSEWSLGAYKDIEGEGKSLKAGLYSIYGMYRFKAHGRDFCVLLCDREPNVIYDGSRPTVLDGVALNQHWGEGSFRGTVFPYGDDGKRVLIQWAMQFPPDGE